MSCGSGENERERWILRDGESEAFSRRSGFERRESASPVAVEVMLIRTRVGMLMETFYLFILHAPKNGRYSRTTG